MYSAVLTSNNSAIALECSEITKVLTEDLRVILDTEWQVTQNLLEIDGQVDLIQKLRGVVH